jgi:hypothetical protein
MTAFSARRLQLPALLLLVALAVGCSGRHPVTGRVLYEDGSAVEAGTVIAEATVDGKPVSVQGNIEKDGSFSLGGDRPGDGVLPGSYKAIVMPVALGDAEMGEGKSPAVDGKFGRYDSSGLTFEAKAEKTVVEFRVTRPKPKVK